MAAASGSKASPARAPSSISRSHRPNEMASPNPSQDELSRMSTNPKEQIFVVISDPQVNYLLERILRSSGFMVTVTRERTSAEKMLEKASPSLVIVSEKLVDGSGMELARSLIDRFPALPILLFVNQDTPELLKEALRAGISDYLCLPLH